MGSYSYNLNSTELFKLLFYKKICPDCQGKLERIKKKEFIKSGWKGAPGGNYSYGSHYNIEINYKCKECSKVVKLEDLGSKR